MVIRLSTVKNLLWFCVILLVALSFPIQVYTRSPYPSLLPYFLIGWIVLLPRKRISIYVRRGKNANMNLMVGIYMFLVLVNTTWQTALGVIRVEEGINALVVYLFPLVFYWYFSQVASEEEIRWGIAAMMVAGFIVGTYFAYDSYVKLALGQVSNYSQAAFEYSVGRAGDSAGDINEARIAAGYRSQGLLESHAVSGTWIVIGALAALTFLARNRKVLRRTVVLLFGTMVLLGLNFTSIIAYSLIMMILEFGGFGEARRRNSSIIGNLAAVTLIVAILAGVALWALGNDMANFILLAFTVQTNLALGTGDIDRSFFDLVSENARTYIEHFSSYPLSLFLGDGFSTYGLPKGGDIGFIETLGRFGLPFFLAVVFCLLRLVASGLRQITAIARARAAEGESNRSLMLQFAVGATLLILISDGHYTVWPAKSVLPIVFLVLALYGRYLPGRRSNRPPQ